MELVFVGLVLGAVVYGIVKDFNPQAVLALAGLAIFTAAYWLGIHPILPAGKGSGFALFEFPGRRMFGSGIPARRGSGSRAALACLIPASMRFRF